MIDRSAFYYFLLIAGIGFSSCNSKHATSAGMINNDVLSRNNKVVNYPLSLAPLENSLSDIRIKSRNVLLKDPIHGMQTFDFDSKGNVYYSQLSGSAKDANGYSKGGDIVYIIKANPNGSASDDYMTLQYFGHGGTVSIEETEGDTYVWVSSNATKRISGDRLESGNYWGAKSISRIKYENGKVYQGYGGENYFLNKGDFFVLIAAIDKSDKYMCFLASTRDRSGLTRYFYTYRLSDVKASPMKDFEFEVLVGGENDNEKEHTVTRKISGHDLSNLKPVGSFSLPPGKSFSDDVNSYSNQGVEIDSGGNIYFYEGNGHSKKRPQGAYVTVFNLDGKILAERSEVAAIADKKALFYSGLTDEIGNMEAEGIKVMKDKIYIGFSSSLHGSDGKTFRGSNIFEYNANEKE